MRSEAVTLIGLVAAVMTSSSLLPQLVKSWRMKETRDISLLMFIIMGAGLFLWFLYGLFIHNIPIMAANSISLAFVLIILFFKVKYG